MCPSVRYTSHLLCFLQLFILLITSLFVVAIVSSDPPVQTSSNRFRSVFLSTFITIFLAEMGDRTQLSTLLMSAESGSPWIVFAGSASALIATSLLGVTIGVWMARRVSPKVLDIAVAILLLFIAALLFGDVVA